MKIHMLSLVPAVAVPMDDSSTLLSLGSQSSTAANLMNAVGHRNVSQMEALIQELAEESVSEPAWKFDEDIQDALKAIKTMFVGSIQSALKDQHKADQEHFNCFTEQCFGDCVKKYHKDLEHCDGMEDDCTYHEKGHRICRSNVYEAYKKMAKKCGELHCFVIPDPYCAPEECTCADLTHCHKADGDQKCQSRGGDCKGKFGGWLTEMITKYQTAYDEWSKLHDECTFLYHAFLTVDMECDVKQREFENCHCKKNRCESQACNVDYDNCEASCWARYEDLVKEKECLEKDRKIDWSATKKIECYIDVLLHDYTKEELLDKCGTADCINKAREEDYKHCSRICPQIDHDGHWPQVYLVDPIKVAGHNKRSKQDEYHLGDGSYQCDSNGDAVFTKHRGGVHREGEARCTEHLDIDYQIPRCEACRPPPEPICSPSFHKMYYLEFDDINRIGCINDCCPETGGNCFDPEMIDSSSDGYSMRSIKVTEHSHAWAYNRCKCTSCTGGEPVYPGRPAGRQCGMGAHTVSPDNNKAIKFQNLCIEPSGDNFASVHLGEDVCVSRITFKHTDGRVSCREASSGDSNWGCDGNNLGLVLSDGAGYPLTAPVFDSVVGMTPVTAWNHIAHWYRMDGVDGNSKEMSWTFQEPYVFHGSRHGHGQHANREYRLWYAEDLTGGTESDNRGRACYDVEMETADKCHALAPLQYNNVCTSAAGNNHGTIALPHGDTCVTEIAVHHVSGYVSCRQADSGKSNYGCDANSIGLVWTMGGQKDVLMPHAGQVDGVTGGGSGHAHWYKMDGVDKSSPTLSMKLTKGPLKLSGSLDLWYNEDLSGGTESDNHGTACYEVSVHRALSC